jgi:hypothetical protein
MKFTEVWQGKCWYWRRFPIYNQKLRTASAPHSCGAHIRGTALRNDPQPPPSGRVIDPALGEVTKWTKSSGSASCSHRKIILYHQ